MQSTYINRPTPPIAIYFSQIEILRTHFGDVK
jgi:hypothetical protein